MKVVEKQLKELRMYENNPRNNDQAVEEVAKSIQEFGFKVPMVIDTNNVIVCGHTRYKACLKLGIESVPCVVADDLSPEQIRAFRLVENKTNELATWDFEKLDEEFEKLGKIDFDSLFYDAQEENNEWFNRENRWDGEKEEGNEEYNEFLEKFEQPKTTDDCYTPDNIYEVVCKYVTDTFGYKKAKFFRPFYPGGDYQNEDYTGKVVVDNPPFSILSEIVDFYQDHDIKFFLFAPSLLCFGYVNKGICAMAINCNVTYENGATVVTGFLTNMRDDHVVAMNDPDLWQSIEEANKINLEKLHANLPKYDYPYDVLTSAKMGWLGRYGQKLMYKDDECVQIRQLDAQRENGKGIYGSGILLSERAAAERAAAQVFKLSDREKEIQKGLR